jgi:hypothetical protein
MGMITMPDTQLGTSLMQRGNAAAIYFALQQMLGTCVESGRQAAVHGLEGHPMDTVERCFLVVGMTCFFVLIGIGLLSLSL